MANPSNVLRAHEQLDTGELTAVSGLREIVRSSWQRSLEHHRDPDRSRPAHALDSRALAAARSSHPLRLVLPVFEQLLAAPAAGTGLLVAIADEHGRMLWVLGDDDALRRASGMGFEAGMDWSEESIGTSAPGTALVTGESVQITGPEHFARSAHPWSCTAVPIRDPRTRRLLGVVDLTGDEKAVARHSQPLVEAAVAAAQAEMRVLLHDSAPASAPADGSAQASAPAPGAGWVPRSVPDPRRTQHVGPVRGPQPAQAGESAGGAKPAPDAEPPGLRFAPSAHEAPVDQVPPGDQAAPRGRGAEGAPHRRGAQDSSRTVAVLRTTGLQVPLLDVAGGPVQLRQRHAEILSILALHPAGVSSAELAALLATDGEPLAAVTLRAEMTRLRKVLERWCPELPLLSRPYRLPAGMSADFLRVTRAIAAGELDAALADYRGELLPCSDSAAIDSERHRLAAALRSAVLESGTPEQLWEYLQLPEAAADEEAWRLGLRILPARSPKRSLVVSHLEELLAGA
ncbi:hypothetical protein ACUXNS_000251 [Brevibacterium pityocampae]